MEDRKDFEFKRFCRKNILAILGFSSIMAVVALIAVGISQHKPLPENAKYGIVLDAGSSHTSMYIYKWPAEKMNDTGVVHQTEECKIQGPGISKYAHKLDEIENYLYECMERAKEVIPSSQHSETPVYLGATAGMRLLRMENEGIADKILDVISTTLSSYPFDFQGARIITGQEEGAYGWITINYLMEKFIKKSNWYGLLAQGSYQQETYGALDLGGASTQITFVPPKMEPVESPDNSLQFRLYGQDYTIYTHSFLCYGKDQALWQKLAKDIEDTSNGVLKDPCFHFGYERVVNVSDLYKTPCTKRFEKTLPFHEFHIQGVGNYQQCHQSILQLFNTSYCPYSQCAFNGIFLPPLQGDFGAFSAFYFVMNFLNLTSKSSLENVRQKMESFCSTPWEEIKTSFDGVKGKYLSEYCFSGIYILSLLLQGYNFTASSWKNIHFMGKIDGSDAGWTLGYMLNLTNMIPAEYPVSKPFSHSTYVFLMVLFSLILVAVIVTALFIFHKPSSFWKEMI
ncbi:ectonucleoside triphosphate diphosphohydrolase 1 isoform X1 [Ochotona princeps]|uniref:ectonucleoside triphosphate diphosphohydrolase 1 isoform X1 n=3 Tax=Ochotona princeps TaxID=9978 RepID=UPI002714929D|nr:ectonucleoside triphosphate diphosphohydrolase 1 isoform X1 [Ochotona princeps]